MGEVKGLPRVRNISDDGRVNGDWLLRRGPVERLTYILFEDVTERGVGGMQCQFAAHDLTG